MSIGAYKADSFRTNKSAEIKSYTVLPRLRGICRFYLQFNRLYSLRNQIPIFITMRHCQAVPNAVHASFSGATAFIPILLYSGKSINIAPASCFADVFKCGFLSLSISTGKRSAWSCGLEAEAMAIPARPIHVEEMCVRICEILHEYGEKVMYKKA